MPQLIGKKLDDAVEMLVKEFEDERDSETGTGLGNRHAIRFDRLPRPAQQR